MSVLDAPPATGDAELTPAPSADAGPFVPSGCALVCTMVYVVDCAGGAYCCTLGAARSLAGCQ